MSLLNSIPALIRSALEDDEERASAYPPTLPPALREAARILERTKVSSPSAARGRLGRSVIDALAAIGPPERPRHARDAGLPRHAAHLGDQAHELLAYFIDDDALRPELGELAIEQWLAIDRHACSAHALSRSDEWTREMLVTLCRGVDPVEAYDAIADRFRRDEQLRAHLGSANYGIFDIVRPAIQDPRFVDLALEHMMREPVVMCRFLAAQGSARACEELCGVLDGAERFDDSVAAAVEGLEVNQPPAAFVEVCARFLRGPAAEGITPGPYVWRINQHVDALRVALDGDSVGLARLQRLATRRTMMIG